MKFAELICKQMMPTCRCLHQSSSGPFHSIAHSFKFRNDSIPLVALDFDSSILNCSASAKPGFQLGGKLGKSIFIQRQIGDDANALATSALRLPTNTNHGGLARFVRLACASLLELVALWADQFSPVVASHRRIFLYAKSNDCQQYQLATDA